MDAKRMKRRNGKVFSGHVTDAFQGLKSSYRRLIGRPEPFANLRSLPLNDQFPERRMLAMAREASRAWFAQKHWGEAIKRLEDLQLRLSPAEQELIEDLKQRRELMESQSDFSHEAAAEWRGLHRIQTVLKSCQESSKALLLQASEEHKTQLTNCGPYHLMLTIEQTWGADCADWCLDVAGCPNLFQLPLLNSSIKDFAAYVKSDSISPNARLKRLVDAPLDSIEEVFAYLDPTTAEPKIDAQRFNQLWDQEIADSNFQQVYVALQQRLLSVKANSPATVSEPNEEPDVHNKSMEASVS